MKLEITKGNIFVGTNIISKSWININSTEYGIFARTFYGKAEPIVTSKEAENNAILIVNAFNTYNKCELLPSELLKQNEALVECLKELHSQTLYALDENYHRGFYTHKPSKLYDKIEELLNTLNK